MSTSKDVLSGPDVQFDGWLETFSRYVAGKTAGSPPARAGTRKGVLA